MSIVLDAGPVLNFLAVGQQNVLIQMALAANATLAAPKRVDTEIEGMCKNPRFARTGAKGTWGTLKASGRVKILADTLLKGPRFDEAIGRISGRPAEERTEQRKSLGEILVLAHASVFAQDGETVYVLIDEADGRNRAEGEQQWLRRQGVPGRLVLWSTKEVLDAAAKQQGWIKGNLSSEAVYKSMRPFDDGIPR